MPIQKISTQASRTRSYFTGAMRGRLILYTFALMTLLGVILMGVIMLFGRFSSVEQRTAENLALRLSVFEQNIINHFDSVAARGVRFSQELTKTLETWLQTENLAFNDLNDNPDNISRLEEALYEPLNHALKQTDCSGAYYLLNATANTTLPDAEYSKCGMYVRIANINVSRPIDPKLVLFRGYTSITRHHRQELHNMWALEFNTNLFSAYDLLMEKANRDLNSCFLFTDSIRLPGTWENVVLFCVPLVGSDGTIYGICGFEISQLFFKLYHAQCGAPTRIMGLLTRSGNPHLDAASGLQTGDGTGYFVELTDTLRVAPQRSFSLYSLDNLAFIGLDTSLRLSPLEEAHQAAVLIPKEDYDVLRRENMWENLIIATLLFFSAVFGSVFMSTMYVKPILEGLKQAKSDKVIKGNIKIQEIDDLLEFLAIQDEKRKTERRKIEKRLAELDKAAERGKFILPDQESYELFLENLVTLTKTEREVFELYRQGHRAKDMPKILSRSMNTIKTHNKRIYDKLGVSSRYELLAYMEMMKQEGLDSY